MVEKDIGCVNQRVGFKSHYNVVAKAKPPSTANARRLYKVWESLPVSQQEIYTTNYIRGIYSQIPLYPFCFANLVGIRVRRAVFEPVQLD